MAFKELHCNSPTHGCDYYSDSGGSHCHCPDPDSCASAGGELQCHSFGPMAFKGNFTVDMCIDCSNVTASDDLDWAPNGTTAHSHSMGWCYSELDDDIGCTASPGDCWAMCEDGYGDDLVAIDWEDGECYCQDDCLCMVDVGNDESYLITRDDYFNNSPLPQECHAFSYSYSYSFMYDFQRETTMLVYEDENCAVEIGGDGVACDWIAGLGNDDLGQQPYYYGAADDYHTNDGVYYGAADDYYTNDGVYYGAADDYHTNDGVYYGAAGDYGTADGKDCPGFTYDKCYSLVDRPLCVAALQNRFEHWAEEYGDRPRSISISSDCDDEFSYSYSYGGIPNDSVLCPGLPAVAYCDCGGDCTSHHLDWCACPEALECCGQTTPVLYTCSAEATTFDICLQVYGSALDSSYSYSDSYPYSYSYDALTTCDEAQQHPFFVENCASSPPVCQAEYWSYVECNIEHLLLELNIDGCDLDCASTEYTYWGSGRGSCSSDLDELVGYASNVDDCWTQCEAAYGSDLVAIDLTPNGECRCQDACECMEDTDDGDIHLITSNDYAAALPEACLLPTPSPTLTSMPTTLRFEKALVAHYSFAGDSLVNEGCYESSFVVDSFPCENQSSVVYENGQESNTTLGTTTGRDGGVALLLDASKNQSLLLKNVASNIYSNNDRTLCLWARVFEWDGASFLEYGDTDGLFGMGVTSNGTGFTFLVDPANERDVPSMTSELGNPTAWHHYCITVGDANLDSNTTDGSYTYWGSGLGKCSSDLDELVGSTSDVDDCWAQCQADFGSEVVAVDWTSHGECRCQDACECMEDTDDDDIHLITGSSIATLPGICP